MKQDAEAYSSNGIGAGQFNGSSGKYGLKAAFVGWRNDEEFDWLSVVLLPGRDLEARRFFFIPSAVAWKRSHKAEHRDGRGIRIANLDKHFSAYEDNFSLSKIPAAAAPRRLAAKAGNRRRP